MIELRLVDKIDRCESREYIRITPYSPHTLDKISAMREEVDEVIRILKLWEGGKPWTKQ